MRDVQEYDEDAFDEEEEWDDADEMRMAIMEAEANEVWLEEPGDEDEEPQLPVNPLLGMFPFGPAGIPGSDDKK